MKRTSSKRLKLDDIAVDVDIQPRAAGIDQPMVEEYAEAMRAGATFPPVRVYDDGKQKWLAQGFHRYAARRAAEFDDIECEVIQGKRADAILDAVGSNATHGVRRTNADKRHAVLMLLNNKTWAKRTDRWIADACGVGHTFVGKLRKEVESDSTRQNGEASNLPKTTQAGKVLLPSRKPQVQEPARVECPNCGHDEVTDDGDCAKCYEPDLVDVEEDFDGFDEFDPSVGIVNLLRDVRNLRAEWPAHKYRVMASILRDLADETERMHDDE